MSRRWGWMVIVKIYAQPFSGASSIAGLALSPSIDAGRVAIMLALKLLLDSRLRWCFRLLPGELPALAGATSLPADHPVAPVRISPSRARAAGRSHAPAGAISQLAQGPRLRRAAVDAAGMGRGHICICIWPPPVGPLPPAGLRLFRSPAFH